MFSKHYDVIIIGSGSAGMMAALELTGKKVALLTKTAGLFSGSTAWAQGGIAAATAETDTPQAHAADTLVAGCYHNNPLAVDALTKNGKTAIAKLQSMGMPFDTHSDGSLMIGHEAAHSHKRVVHAGGDATGKHLSQTLSQHVMDADHIDVYTSTMASRLLKQDGTVCGLVVQKTQDGTTTTGQLLAPAVILATGGIGQLFARTTNPCESTADGLALALQAGAEVADLAFVQFHPTALDIPHLSTLPLLTEALRGDGAHLLDKDGKRFMLAYHRDGELAPRDVVARGIWQAKQKGTVYLDVRHLRDIHSRFPTVTALCAKHGFNPKKDLLPVTPAAHYHMGGVRTDLTGQTSISGLYAIGEVAHTGVHGANRLASNSLLECLVFAKLCAASILQAESKPTQLPQTALGTPTLSDKSMERLADLPNMMFNAAGLLRHGQELSSALKELQSMRLSYENSPSSSRYSYRQRLEAANRHLVSMAILEDALARPQSLGAHQRLDDASQNALTA